MAPATDFQTLIFLLLQISNNNSNDSTASVSSIEIRNLSRLHDGSVYKCLVFSQALHRPLIEAVTIDVICKLIRDLVFLF